MANKVSKAKRNPFFWFMLEIQKQEREKGNTVTMNDLPGICSPSWDAMSKDQKNFYERKAMAFRSNGASQADINLSLPTTHVTPPVSSEQVLHHIDLLMAIEARDEGYKEFIANVVNRIICDEEVMPYNRIRDASFFIGVFNVLCVTQSKDYIPNELGLVEYSINDGIIKSLHQFVHCGPPPVGYYRTAMEHSEKNHK